MSLDEEDLNLSWTNEFYQTIQTHSVPEPELVDQIRVSCVYLNEMNEVDAVDTIKEPLDSVTDPSFSLYTDVRLLNLIENRKIRNSQRYKMTDILSYIVDLHQGNWVQQYESLVDGFFKSHHFPETIRIPSTIAVFHRLNMLWIVFRPLVLVSSGDFSDTPTNTTMTSILKKAGSYPRTKKKVRLVEPVRNKTAKHLNSNES